MQSLPALLAKAGYRTAQVGKRRVASKDVFYFETAIPGNARNSVQMADNCRDFLANRDSRPFCRYFCTADPHRSGGSAPGA